MKISVIIPTLNASAVIKELLDRLLCQTVKADEIIVVDSASDDNTVALAKACQNVRVLEIERREFDHGGTRDLALRASKGDFVIFLTQDAVPANDRLIENLLRPFEDAQVSGVSGRQLPKADAKPYERLIREFNYPAKSFRRTKEDIPRLGIKTFFFSDACAAYRREVYLDLGGFEKNLLTDEDLFFAAKMIHAGYALVYAADAEVFHSHNLSLQQQYERNRMQGIEFKKHAQLLSGVSLEGEGVKMVKDVSKKLLSEGKVGNLLAFWLDCGARFLGSRAGRK